MKRITLFYLTGCPYCDNARKALKELAQADPAYGRVEVDWIEESRESELAEKYDYYYVPSIFDGQVKLYEADPSESYADCREKVRTALDAVLAGE